MWINIPNTGPSRQRYKANLVLHLPHKIEKIEFLENFENCRSRGPFSGLHRSIHSCKKCPINLMTQSFLELN
jgi:hypothetical protein